MKKQPTLVWVKILTYDVYMSDTIPFSEVKAHLSELADRVERQHDRILVTRNGRPSFILLSPDDLESLRPLLGALPLDPYRSGEAPLSYAHEAGKVRVWSWYENQTAQGGPEPTSRFARDETGDFVIVGTAPGE